MTHLTVEVFNVGFGDAILVTIPDDEVGARRLLIDCGNAFAGEGGDDELLLTVMKRIAARLDGDPVDVYLSTHEHLDHIQGPGLLKKKTGDVLRARRVWMTASSHPDYYETHPNARVRKRLADDVLDDMAAAALAMDGAPPIWFDSMLAINNARSSKQLVDFIREEMPMDEPVDYIARGAAPNHPFQKTTLRFLAPEQDTSVYYGRLRPRAAGVADLAMAAGENWSSLDAPAGVDPADLARLLESRAEATLNNLLQIDRAGNDSSVVLELEWQGWRLLFTADAEEKSWAIMERRDVLRPVHFLKISHHASHNGSPKKAMDIVLPKMSPDGRPRFAIASTRAGTYNNVPDAHTIALLEDRATVLSTETIADGASRLFVFTEDGAAWHEIVDLSV